MPAALQTPALLYQALRLPVKGNEPKAPALTLPDSLSPSTVPEKSRVSGMGLVIFADQVSALPSTLPFSSGPEPCAACWVPVSTLPSVLISRLAFCAPRGELMTISHLPSTAMSVSWVNFGGHLRTPRTPAQGAPWPTLALPSPLGQNNPCPARPSFCPRPAAPGSARPGSSPTR